MALPIPTFPYAPHQVLALQNGNGQLLTFDGLTNGGDMRSSNRRSMIVRGAWRQDVCCVVGSGGGQDMVVHAHMYTRPRRMIHGFLVWAPCAIAALRLHACA